MVASRTSFKAARSLLVAPKRSLHHAAPLAQAASAPSTSASSAAPASSTATTQSASASSDQAASSSSSNTLVSSLILSRPPTILRQPSKFEQAYFDYNRQLSQALQQPFPKDFYFKKGSAAEKRFDQEQASEPQGFKQPSAKNEAAKSNEAAATESGGKADAASTLDPEADARPLPRETDADRKNDLQSLERKLDRTLYLLVKTQSGSKSVWTFPKKALDRQTKDSLHSAAPEAVTSALGKNIDIWMVSNSPIALYRSGKSEKTYFMKGHVVAGKPQLGSSKQVQEFRWLTKEEIQELLSKEKASEYWQTVEELLDP